MEFLAGLGVALVQSLDTEAGQVGKESLVNVDLAVLHQPLAAINVGLESFTESLGTQGAQVIHLDWRPPASGDEKLMAILERMKNK